MSSTEKRALSLAALLLLASLAALVHPWYVRNADAAMYIVTARALAAGEGYRFLGEPFLVRPPGFSLLLTPVIALRGGSDFAWLNGLVALCGAFGVAALYALARPRLGWPLALVAAGLLWLNPGYQRLCTTILSDVPGTAAALACLAWEMRRGERRTATEWGFAVAIACAVWLRSANLLLIPAIVLARTFAMGAPLDRDRLVACLRTPVAALLLAAPWFVYGALQATDQPADQTRLAGYATAMFHEDPGDPSSRALGAAEIAARVPQRAVQLLAVLGTRLDTTVKGGEHDPRAGGAVRAAGRDGAAVGALSIAIGAAMLLGLLLDGWRARNAAAWFALGSTAVLLVYFGFQDRLALPIFALALVSSLAWLREGASRWLGESRATLVVGVAALGVGVVDFAPREGWAALQQDHERMRTEAALVGDELAAGERVASWRGFHHAVFLERPVYSLHRSVGRLGAAEGIAAVVGPYRVDTVFLTVGGLSAVRDELSAQYGPPRRLRGSATGEVWRVVR